MPFQKIYAADFRNSGLNPIWNPYSFPPLQMSADSANTNHQWTGQGLILGITRNQTDLEIRNSLYLVPPGGISMNSRLFLRVTFDHPFAVGRQIIEARADKKKKAVTTSQKSKSALHMNTDLEVEYPYLYPEPWAVGLRFSSVNHILDKTKAAIVTCQFNRDAYSSGVRLNTPEHMQDDDSAYLESPLNYAQYQNPGFFNPNPGPGNEDFHAKPAPIFTLTHSFSGRNLSETQHTTGAGFLKITRRGEPDSIDHRVYSRKAIANMNTTSNINPLTRPGIKALGLNLATNKGIGWMSVRLLTFEIWWDISSDPLTPLVSPGL